MYWACLTKQYVHFKVRQFIVHTLQINSVYFLKQVLMSLTNSLHFHFIVYQHVRTFVISPAD